MANDKKPVMPQAPTGTESPNRHKVKRPKQPTKPNPAKKRKCEGASCSMFLAELSKKLTTKKKQEEDRNIIQAIIDSITNALPVRFTKRTPPKKESPIKIEALQAMAPELIPSDTVEIKVIKPETVTEREEDVSTSEPDPGSTIPHMPHMPLVDSNDVLKIIAQSKHDTVVEDASVNTSGSLDVAGAIAKHVSTLKKISLIAEEFNQKTAKNLKEIVDSVRLDLLKKLEEVQAEEKSALKVTGTPVGTVASPSPPASLPPVEPMQTI